MATLDTLQILIEADSRGLETQLKRATSTIQDFVEKMNGEQVNWQKVLAGSLDTAIISGIASSFALAITQTLAFQDSLLNVSNNTASSLGTTSQQMDALAGLAGQTGAGLSGTASAFNAFNKQFNNAAAAQQLTAMAGQLALASGISLSELAPVLINLFNEWGVNTLPAAEDALTGLANEASKGKYTLGELIDVISKGGGALSKYTNITEMATQLQALSEQSGMTKNQVTASFDAIVNDIATKNPTVIALVGDLGKKISQKDGLVGAFELLATKIQGMPTLAQSSFASMLGISGDAFTGMSTVGVSNFSKVKEAADDARIHIKSFDDTIQPLLSDIDRLAQAWSGLMGLLSKSIGMPVIEKLTSFLNSATDLLSGSAFSGGITNSMAKVYNDLNSLTFGGLGAISGIPNIPVGAGNQPSASNTTSKQTNMTVNITNNISGGADSATSTHTLGRSMADNAYHAFMGLLSSL